MEKSSYDRGLSGMDRERGEKKQEMRKARPSIEAKGLRLVGAISQSGEELLLERAGRVGVRDGAAEGRVLVQVLDQEGVDSVGVEKKDLSDSTRRERKARGRTEPSESRWRTAVAFISSRQHFPSPVKDEVKPT